MYFFPVGFHNTLGVRNWLLESQVLRIVRHYVTDVTRCGVLYNNRSVTESYIRNVCL